MSDYTKAVFGGLCRASARRGRLPGTVLGLWLAFGLWATAAAGGVPSARLPAAGSPQTSGPPPAFDFSTWHFPVPAGEWLISRGPCGSGGLFTHPCGYFEDECAFDLVPVSGNMMSVPVLAPQAGQVFFLGTRTDTGMAVFLQHDDGRISAMLHLSKVVVGLDQRVAQGQVLGYAGTTGYSGQPHVHFFVQNNAVERSCLPLTGLDEMDLRLMTIVSHNLAWTALVLPDPPPNVPIWLPLVGIGADPPDVLLPARVVVAPLAQATVPIAVSQTYLGSQSLLYDGQVLTPASQANGYNLYRLPILGPDQPGDYLGSLQFQVAGPVFGAPPVTFAEAVRDPVDTSAAAGLVWINPTAVSPPDHAVLNAAPELCYSEPAVAGPAPLSYRVMVSGAAQADSGWISAACWTPPALGPGTYFWNVFVRDGQGHMNRTSDWPHVFRIA